jgi:hypothetical protein
MDACLRDVFWQEQAPLYKISRLNKVNSAGGRIWVVVQEAEFMPRKTTLL